MAVNLSYPKARGGLEKIISIARTDSSTEKAWIPKDAVIIGVYVIQSTACDGTTGTISVGFSGGGTEILNAFNASTNDAGYHAAGAAAGSTVIAGTKLTEDKKVIATFTAGDSTAGGDGFVKIEYVVLGGGESITS